MRILPVLITLNLIWTLESEYGLRYLALHFASRAGSSPDKCVDYLIISEVILRINDS